MEAVHPNDVWLVDCKGRWDAQGEWRVPLMVTDAASRYILAIRLIPSGTAEAVKAVFEELFARYGMPKAIRSGTGVPFTITTSPLGLTRLSAWWIYLGIRPDHTDFVPPFHEQLRADLRWELQGKMAGGMEDSQRSIDAWAEEYNAVRPHESIGMKASAQVYTRSDTPYEGLPEAVQYPMGFETRRINKHGCVKIHKTPVPVSTALRGLAVGLQPQGESGYVLWLGAYPLGTVSMETFTFSCWETPPPPSPEH